MFRAERAAHDFPGEPRAACRDLPVSTPGRLDATFLADSAADSFTEATHEKCSAGKAGFLLWARQKSPERARVVQ